MIIVELSTMIKDFFPQIFKTGDSESRGGGLFLWNHQFLSCFYLGAFDVVGALDIFYAHTGIFCSDFAEAFAFFHGVVAGLFLFCGFFCSADIHQTGGAEKTKCQQGED